MKLYKEFYSIESLRDLLNKEFDEIFNIDDVIEFWLLGYFQLLLNFDEIYNNDGRLLDGTKVSITYENELEQLNFDDNDDILGVFSDLEDTGITYRIDDFDGTIHLIAGGLLSVARYTAEVRKNGICVGLIGVGRIKKIENNNVPASLTKISLNQEIPFSKFRILKSDVLQLIHILKSNASECILEERDQQAVENIERLNDGTQKAVTGKSETAYLNIIQALKDELISHRFKNQDELIEFLADKYTGYTGLSETNLRDKFAKANKI